MPLLDVAVSARNTSGSAQADSERPQKLLRSAWRKSYAGLAAIGVFSIFINVLKLAGPLYVLQILDRVISSRSHETLIMLTIVTLLAVVSAVSLEAVRRRMFMQWGTWIERNFGPRLFSRGLKQDSGQEASSSRMLREVATVRSFVSGSGLIAWLDIIWAPVFAGLVFLISPPLAYIVITATLITLILGTLNELITRDSRDAANQARKDDRDWVATAERHRETVGSMNMAANLAERWSRSASTRLDEGMRTQAINVYFAAAMSLVGRCSRIAILCVGLWLVIEQSLTLGTVIAANVLGRTAYSLVERAMLKWREMINAKRSYQRIKTFLAKDITRQVSLPRTKERVPLIIEKVSYRYPNQPSPVFRGIEVTIEPGEVLCVIGQSAIGKTTFSRLVSGLVSPRSGKIRLGDVDVSRLQQHSTRRDIGHLPQDVTLFQGTVRVNIARMGEGNIRRVIRAAKLAGIHDTILKLPQGYDTEIVENEPLLSGGQRKGIALARAFYGAPPLIVMDEPTPHLDEMARSALSSAISRLKRNGTIVVFTTQSSDLIGVADKVILLKGTKVEVLRTREEVAALRRGTGIRSVRSNSNRNKSRQSDSASTADRGTRSDNSRSA